jgi:hypothetical protein
MIGGNLDPRSSSSQALRLVARNTRTLDSPRHVTHRKVLSAIADFANDETSLWRVFLASMGCIPGRDFPSA